MAFKLVFPFLDQGGEPSPHVEPVCAAVQKHGFRAVIETVDYEFQHGGNRMLRIWRALGTIGR